MPSLAIEKSRRTAAWWIACVDGLRTGYFGPYTAKYEAEDALGALERFYHYWNSGRSISNIKGK